MKVVPLRYGVMFKKAFGDREVADSLDGQTEEARYDEPLMMRVIGAIRDDAVSPDDLARLKDEAAWEDTKREERAEVMRETLPDLCEAYGISLSPAQRAEIAALDLTGLERLRGELKRHKAWPAEPST